MLCTDNFHLKASIPQLTTIKTNDGNKIQYHRAAE